MLTQSYIIHSQKLNNSNTIVYLLTKDFGFIQAFYNKKNYNKTDYKHSKQSILQPFNNILVKLNNKKNQIISIEENFEYINNHQLNNNYFYKAYMNELIFVFYKSYKNDPNSIIFQSYQDTLVRINESKTIIHNFENDLLKDLGFEINFSNNFDHIDNKYFYYNVKDNQFIPIEINRTTLSNLNINTEKVTLRNLIDSLVFSKEIFLNLKSYNYNNDINLYAVKKLNYCVIQHHLDYKKILCHAHLN